MKTRLTLAALALSAFTTAALADGTMPAQGTNPPANATGSMSGGGMTGGGMGGGGMANGQHKPKPHKKPVATGNMGTNGGGMAPNGGGMGNNMSGSH